MAKAKYDVSSAHQALAAVMCELFICKIPSSMLQTKYKHISFLLNLNKMFKTLQLFHGVRRTRTSVLFSACEFVSGFVNSFAQLDEQENRLLLAFWIIITVSQRSCILLVACIVTLFSQKRLGTQELHLRQVLLLFFARG